MIKKSFEKNQRALYVAALLSLPLLALALLFYYRPFWGVMDDSTNLYIADDMRREGVLPIWWKLTVIDLFDHGRLRALYFAMVALIYVPGGTSSVVAFGINIVFLFGIFLFSAAAFWYAARDAFALSRRNAFYFAFITLCFAYPWTVHAIRAPSVQEKIVLLLAAIVLLVQYKFERLALGRWAFLVGLAVATSLQTKETIALFFPLFLAVQLHLDHPKRYYVRTGILLLFLLLSSGLLKWAGTHGTYKLSYGMERALLTLANSKSLYLFLLLALAAGSASVIDYLRHKNLTRLFLALSFPVGLLLFIVLMLPWGLGGYLNCSAILFVVMCLIGLFKFSRDRFTALMRVPLKVFAGLTYCSAILVTFVLLSADYSTYADFRRVLFSDAVAAMAQNGNTLWMPCAEGAGTVEHYLKRFRGLKVNTLTPEGSVPMEAGQFWLTSPGNCSNEHSMSEWIERGEAETLVAPQRKGGYTLVRRLKAP